MMALGCSQSLLDSEAAEKMVRYDPTLVDPKLSVMWQMIAAMHGKKFQIW